MVVESNYFIYALLCPDTNTIKYIGLTTIGLQRIRLHRKDIRPNKHGRLIKVKAWVKSLMLKNKTFNFKILEYCNTKKQLIDREIFWINFYKDLNLLNHTLGGFLPTVYKFSDLQKLEISKRTKLAMNKPQIREKFLKAHSKRNVPKIYKKWSNESKLKVSNSKYHSKMKKRIIDSNGTIYESLISCAKSLGVTKQAVSRCLSGKQKTVKNLKITVFRN